MISYYELLGIIKDGNIPKKVEYLHTIYEWDGLNYVNNNKISTYLSGNINDVDMFDKTIEIIEKDKYIEELYISKNDITYPDGAINDDELVDCILEITSKINEIRKEVNKLRKEIK